MATYSGQIRQGLPRVAGGEPWPAAGSAPALAGVLNESVSEIPESEISTNTAPETVASPHPEVASGAPASANNVLRRGLPRVAGGEPWPEAKDAPITEFTKSVYASSVTQSAAPSVAPSAKPSFSKEPVAAQTTSTSEATPSVASTDTGTTGASGADVRRGLPRVAGGPAWPEGASVPAWAIKDAKAAEAPAASAQPVADKPMADKPVTEAVATEAVVTEEDSTAIDVAKPASTTQTSPKHAAPAPAYEKLADDKPAAQKTDTSQATAQKPAPAKAAPKPREPIMIGQKSLAQWVKIVVLGAIGAVVAAAILVLAARGVTTLPGVPEFMERYPGEYVPLAQADPGFPAWARWSHFLNIFLMVLIIRSGMHVRTQQKPPAFWTPKKGGKKISINLWLHTSLDLIWVANGIIFVVLLFISGHWSRIIPTSLEVFPNAASAMLQYMTLDWPTENGWVNYNSLQQIMYFLVIFVAAPLAIITGVRMSEWWPEKADRLNKIYPAPLARAIHFPVMLFFVLFILVHVFLVLSTGALRNLNHMFVGTDVVNWTGFWLFALAIAVTVGGWFAARPLILAPIANLFGRVSNR